MFKCSVANAELLLCFSLFPNFASFLDLFFVIFTLEDMHLQGESICWTSFLLRILYLLSDLLGLESFNSVWSLCLSFLLTVSCNWLTSSSLPSSTASEESRHVVCVTVPLSPSFVVSKSTSSASEDLDSSSHISLVSNSSSIGGTFKLGKTYNGTEDCSGLPFPGHHLQDKQHTLEFLAVSSLLRVDVVPTYQLASVSPRHNTVSPSLCHPVETQYS